LEGKKNGDRRQTRIAKRRTARMRSSATEMVVEGYEILLRPAKDSSRDLIVVLSSGGGFALYKNNFNGSVLFIADLRVQYYLFNLLELAQSVGELVDRGGYRRVIFIGSSKAGFGALSVARLCARRRPRRIFHAIAFSPQVQLYPLNANLYFNSYRRLNRHAARNKRLGRLLRRYGDLSLVGAQKNLVSELVYARDAVVDRAEALRVTGSNVRRRLVAGAGHGTVFHFVCHGLDRRQIAKRIDRAYRHAEDKDLIQTRPADVGVMVEEIVSSALEGPTLNEVIAEVLSRTPTATPLWARGLGLARRALTLLVGSIEKTLRPAPAKS
jgi:hypothetical protein